ncbi:phage tail protein I [Sphingobium sp.]|uniref:phage tail protein I n=1 Tax=Sphingobium sp. TaxID=1912891 RepID=UPI0028BD484F|nr:phage tail protein I [Sphingobium sp.]
MADAPHLLPPNASPIEKALSLAPAASLEQVPVVIDEAWNAYTCPAHLLPYLAGSLSIDIWDSDWTEAVKRAAIADAIQFQRRKGTRASLRTVLDRFDPQIGIVEWFEDRDTLDPYHFRLELPLLAESDVLYNETLVARILRDIAQVKPVRANMLAVFRVKMAAEAWLLSGARTGGLTRLEPTADTQSALEPEWATYLQTADGEPILDGAGAFLEV